jgi:hypothetical protein
MRLSTPRIFRIIKYLELISDLTVFPLDLRIRERIREKKLYNLGARYAFSALNNSI